LHRGKQSNQTATREDGAIVTLDDVEQTAREFMFHASHFGLIAEIHNGRWTSEQITDLARAVLVLLPVVRASELYYGAMPCEVIEALADMHALIGTQEKPW
jgi:hypothetical protein